MTDSTAPEDTTPPRRSRKRRGVLAAAGAAVVAAVTAILLFGPPTALVQGWPSGTGEQDNRSSTQDAEREPAPDAAPSANDKPEPSAAPRPKRTAAVEDATAALTRFLTLSDTALHSPEDDPAGLDAVADGPAMSELENTISEFRASGWRQRGSVTVVDTTTTDVTLTASTPSVRLTVCLDSSDVEVVDGNGDPVWQRVDGEVRRNPHLYTVELSEGAWRVVEHTFPDESTC